MDSQFISLQQAIEMTSLYRNQKETILKEEFRGRDILAISETFESASIYTVLGQPDCTALRIYLGMSEDLKIHAIIVGVNDKNEDVLPSSETKVTADPPIVENGLRCPPNCAIASPLNG